MAAPATVTEELSFKHHCQNGGKVKGSDDPEARKPALLRRPAQSRGVTRHGLFRRGDINRCVFAGNRQRVNPTAIPAFS